MYLCIDVGTHSVRAALCSQEGEWRPIRQVPLKINPLANGNNGWVEQDPLEISNALAQVVKCVLAEGKCAVKAAGLSCQRSSVLAWNTQTIAPLSNVLSWQDTRGMQSINSLIAHSQTIQAHSGLKLSAHYGATKLHWLQQNYPLNKGVVYTPLVSYLIACLTGANEALCDHTNAGRTQLFNIHSSTWDSTLAELFKVNLEPMAKVLPTQGPYGGLDGVGSGHIPLTTVMGDQNAALLGALNLNAPAALVNCGTGAFVLSYLPCVPKTFDEKDGKNLLQSVAFSTEQQRYYLSEGTVNGAGAAFTWLLKQKDVQQQLAQLNVQSDAAFFEQLDKWLAQGVEPPGVFINAVGGVGSPYWLAQLAPEFVPANMSLEQKAIAVVESIVFLLAKNIRLMNSQQILSELIISGGLSRLDGLCQLLANVSGLVVKRLANHETTLQGVGVATSKCELSPNVFYNAQFSPMPMESLAARVAQFYQRMEANSC